MKKYPIYKLRYGSKNPAVKVGNYTITECPDGKGLCTRLYNGLYKIHYFDNTASGPYGLITYKKSITEKRIKNY